MQLIGFGDSHVWGDSFAKFAAHHLGLHFTEHAVMGERIEAIYNRRTSVKCAPNDIVVISAGANDIAAGPWDGIPNISRYVGPLSTSFCCRVVLCTIIPWVTCHEDHIVSAANEIIRGAAEESGAVLFDAFRFLKKPNGSPGNLNDYRDTCHMSERGNYYLSGLLCHLINREFVSDTSAGAVAAQ